MTDKAKASEHDLREGSKLVNDEFVRNLIERIGEDAIRLTLMRNELYDDDGNQIVPIGDFAESIVHDILGVLTGDDLGCTEENDLTPENSTHKFTLSQLAAILEENQRLLSLLNDAGVGHAPTLIERVQFLINWKNANEHAATHQQAENQRLAKELEEAQRSRKSTQDWYAGRYGKLHDWARKRLPENFQNEFFGCIANGLWHYADDIGESYKCADGSTITPSGYFKMDTAQEQILHDQSDRAEAAEAKLGKVREVHNALTLAKKLLWYLTQHAPGYDWNADPQYLTLKIGQCSEWLDEALEIVSPNLGPLSIDNTPSIPSVEEENHLYVALRKLRNEVDGWMQWDHALIELGGLVNVNVLKQRLFEAEAAIIRYDERKKEEMQNG